MATIPSTAHGKDSVLKLDDAAGSLTDLSCELNAISSSETVEVEDDTTLCQRSRSHVIGMVENGAVELAGNYNATTAAHAAGIFGSATSKTIEYDPAGTGSGTRKATAESDLTAIEISADIGSVVSISMTMSISGDVTYADN